MIDWSTLRPTQKGLAVEGDDDKQLVETFLEAGQKQGLWQNWHTRLMVEVPKNPSGFAGVQREVGALANQGRVWGLIDRDWRTAGEIASLQAQYSQLLVLPRVMVAGLSLREVRTVQHSNRTRAFEPSRPLVSRPSESPG